MPAESFIRTILHLLILPSVLAGLTLVGIPSSDQIGTGMFFWFVCGIGFDIVFAVPAREKLLTEFRAQTAVVPEEPLGLLGELGRMLGK